MSVILKNSVMPTVRQNVISDIEGRIHSFANPHRAHEDSIGRPEEHAIHPGLRPMQQQLLKYAIHSLWSLCGTK